MKEKKKRFKPPFRPKPGKKIRHKKKSDPYIPSTHESIAISTNASERAAYNQTETPKPRPAVRAVNKSTREVILEKIKQPSKPAVQRPRPVETRPPAAREDLESVFRNVSDAAMNATALTASEKKEAQVFLARRLGAHLVDFWLVDWIASWAILASLPGSSWGWHSVFWLPTLGLPSILVGLVYFGVCYEKLGATPGKMLFRLKLRMEKGGNVPWLRAYLRETIGKFLSILPAFAGVLMSLMRKDHRALHDFVFGTRVVNASEAIESTATPRF